MNTRELIEGIANGELEARDIRPYLTDRSDAKDFAFSLFCSTESGEVYFVETNQDEIDDNGKGNTVCDEWNVQVRDLTIVQEQRNNRIHKAIEILEKYYGFSLFEDEPTNSNLFEDEPTNSKMKKLPDELSNDEAKRYFTKAIEYGLMGEDYVWRAAKRDLAYFAAKMSDKLRLTHRVVYNNITGKSEYAISWIPFENCFGEKKGSLRGEYSKIRNGFCEPQKKDIIDLIFN